MVIVNGRDDDNSPPSVIEAYVKAARAAGNVQPIVYSGPGAPNYRKPLSLGTAEAIRRWPVRTHCNEGRDVSKPRGHHFGHWR